MKLTIVNNQLQSSFFRNNIMIKMYLTELSLRDIKNLTYDRHFNNLYLENKYGKLLFDKDKYNILYLERDDEQMTVMVAHRSYNANMTHFNVSGNEDAPLTSVFSTHFYFLFEDYDD